MIGIVIAVIVVFIIIFLVIAEKVFERTNYYKKNYTQTDKLKGMEKVDYVNTGSTFAYYGIDYESVCVSGLNLALCPQPIASDFKMLKHFENRYNPGTTVFIVISDLAFAKKSYTETQTADKYYKVLDMSEIDGYNSFKAIRAKYLPVLYSWKNFLRFHWDIKPDREYECMVNENDREAVEADALKRCQSWKQEFGLKNLNDASQGQKFADEFSLTSNIVKEMVIWCKEKGLNPILVNLPVAVEMENCFSQKFLNAFYYDQVNQIVRGTGVKFVDLQKKGKLSDYLLYLDSCRLNKAGREIITRLLINEAGKQ